MWLMGYGPNTPRTWGDEELWAAMLADRRKQEQRKANRAVYRGLLMFVTFGISELIPALRAW